MHPVKLSFFLLAFCCAASVVNAQYFNTAYKFVTYTTKDGLSDNAVTKSICDRNRFLWVATRNGLNKFNGYSFKKYTFIPGDSTSLRSIWVTDLLLDTNGLLWVSTEWGICYYDEKFDCFRYVNPKNDVQILYKGPLCKGAGNSIWLAAENGLKKIDVVSKKIYSTSLKRISDPQSILCDKNGQIWIGTKGHGLYVYNTITNTCKENYTLPAAADAHIMGLYNDSDTALYAATSYGLMCISNAGSATLYNKGIGALANVVCDALMCITKFEPLLGSNYLLCGTYNNNLLLFDTKQKVFTERLKNAADNLNDYPIGVFSDLFCLDKILWVATDHGLSKLNLEVQDMVTNRLPVFYNTNKRCLLKQMVADTKDGNVLWALQGKDNGGIVKYNFFSDKVVPVNKILAENKDGKQPLYTDLITDSSHYIWAFTSKYIDRYSLDGNTSKRFKIPCSALSADMDAQYNFWMGTASGLAYFNTTTGVTEIYDCTFQGTPLENTSFAEPFPVQDVKDDKQHTVWLTCIKYGLFSFNKLTKKFTAHRQPFTTAYETKNRSSAVCITPDGKIWYSTMAGLSCYNSAKKSFTNYNSKNGLQSTYIYSIGCIDNKQIWGRGNTGVFVFDVANETVKNFSLPQDHNGTYFDQKISFINGNTVMGFEGGYSIFHNEKKDATQYNKTFISQYRVLNKPFYFDNIANENEPAVFSYEENIFRFDFTSIDYNNTDALNFYYQLQGFDKDWIKANAQSFIIYNNLEPGKYIFKVKAGTGNMVSDAGVARFSFAIQPPFWKTVWFVLPILLLVGAIGFSIYKYRIKQLKKFYEVRSSISRNLHDEIGATLSSINIYSDVARNKTAEEDTKQLADKMYEASAKAMESMSDIVWYVNPQNDLLENMLVRMREYALPLLEAKSIQVIFTSDEKVEAVKLTMQQRQHLYLIFKEAVNNILKYAAAINVLLLIVKETNEIRMLIKDDGKGFAMALSSSGNGLKNMQFRATALGGKLLIESAFGKGTTVTLHFPIT